MPVTYLILCISYTSIKKLFKIENKKKLKQGWGLKLPFFPLMVYEILYFLFNIPIAHSSCVTDHISWLQDQKNFCLQRACVLLEFLFLSWYLLQSVPIEILYIYIYISTSPPACELSFLQSTSLLKGFAQSQYSINACGIKQVFKNNLQINSFDNFNELAFLFRSLVNSYSVCLLYAGNHPAVHFLTRIRGKIVEFLFLTMRMT